MDKLKNRAAIDVAIMLANGYNASEMVCRMSEGQRQQYRRALQCQREQFRALGIRWGGEAKA